MPSLLLSLPTMRSNLLLYTKSPFSGNPVSTSRKCGCLHCHTQAESSHCCGKEDVLDELDLMDNITQTSRSYVQISIMRNLNIRGRPEQSLWGIPCPHAFGFSRPMARVLPLPSVAGHLGSDGLAQGIHDPLVQTFAFSSGSTGDCCVQPRRNPHVELPGVRFLGFDSFFPHISRNTLSESEPSLRNPSMSQA